MAFSGLEIQQMLEEPFDPTQVKQRQGAYGKSLSYIDGPTVYRRLNESTNGWSFEIDRSYFDTMISKNGEHTKVMIVEGHLSIPELGKRAGTGVQKLDPGSGEDMYKGARTDAIKNAASLFGVGLHLYSDVTTDASERGYGMNNRPQQGNVTQGNFAPPPQDDDYVPSEMQYGNYQQQGEQQPQYQKATGDRVRGGATVKQVNAIKAISADRGVGDEQLEQMVAQQTDGSMELDDLTSKGASNIIGNLNSMQ